MVSSLKTVVRLPRTFVSEGTNSEFTLTSGSVMKLMSKYSRIHFFVRIDSVLRIRCIGHSIIYTQNSPT